MKVLGNEREERVYKVDCKGLLKEDFFISSSVLEKSLYQGLYEDFSTCKDCVMHTLTKSPRCIELLARSSLAVLSSLRKQEKEYKEGGGAVIGENASNLNKKHKEVIGSE